MYLQKQDQLKKEKKNEKDNDSDNEIDEDDEVFKKKIIKDMDNKYKVIEAINNKNQEQTQKLLNIDEKINDYNKEVKKGDELMNVINYGIFEASKNYIFGLFSDNKEENN